MKYVGKLFGKFGKKYIELDIDSKEVDRMDDKIIELEKEIERLKGDQWISVDDRLPEDGKYVLCIYKKNLPFIAMYYDGDFKTFHEEITHPTHWQPLPSKPKDNQNEQN